MKGHEDLAERTCIVTREVKDPSQLIRFVAGPDGMVVPDLKRNLPGRGVWVSASKSSVKLAVDKSAFSKGLKRSVRADKGLPDMVENVLSQAALSALGFARKAGQCMTGAGKVERAIRNSRAIGVLHATDGADDGIRKLSHAVYALERDGFQKPEIWRIFSSTQMSMALGATNVIHAALMEGSAARNCLQRVAELSTYREMEPS